MNISNTISHDSIYSKRDLSDIQIKQNIPEIKDSLQLNDRLDAIEIKDKSDEITDVTKKSNEYLQTFDRKLEISIHEETREVMVKVIDTNTDEIIRELPPEKVLDNVADIREKLGLFLDKRI